MYDLLKHTHSGLRWLLLIFIVIAIANAFMKKNSATEYSKSDKMPVLLTLIFTHIQILIGLVLYFISPRVSFHAGFMKEAASRFYGIEHISMMLIAVILITIGYSKSKRQTDIGKKHSTVFFYYLIGFIIMMVSIPWPFRAALGGGWF
jgi:hypothetical protein